MRQTVILFSILFLVMLGFGIIIPILPFYAENLGASEALFGWLMASYSIMQFFFAPIWGRLSDRIGRKPVLIIGLVGYIVSFTIFAFSEELWMLFLARLIAGLLSSATLPTAMAMIADQTTDEERGKSMGILGAGIGLGFILGPAIGGLLSRYSLFGLSPLASPFLFTAAISLVPLILAIIFIKETLIVRNRTNKGIHKKRSYHILKSHLSFVYLAAFIVSFTLAGLESTFAYFAKDRANIDSYRLGYIFAIMGTANAFVQGGLIGRLIKFGEEITIKIGLTISSVGFMLIVFADSFWELAIFLPVFGIGNGMMRPSISSLISKKTKIGYGSAIGIMDSMDSLGRIIGPPVSGILYLYVIEAPFIMGAIFTFGFMIIFHFWYKLHSFGYKSYINEL